MRMNKNRELMAEVEKKNNNKSITENGKKFARGMYALSMAMSTFFGTATLVGTTALAQQSSGGTKDGGALSSLSNALTSVGKVVGAGLVIYGLYEVIMSILQQAAEQKTKGLVMCAVGVVLAGFSFAAPSLG